MRERFAYAMQDKGKRTAVGLVGTSAFFDLLLLTVNIFIKDNELGLVNNRLAYSLGIVSGFAVVAFMIIHMYATLEKAMLCDKKNAKRKTKLGAFVRMLVIVGALILGALFPDYISLAGIMGGILTLKIAALLWPWIDKFANNLIKKEV